MLTTPAMKKIAASALALAMTACGGADSSSTPAAPIITAVPTPVLFEGQLAVGGSAFYSFTVAAQGDADVMLASVTTSTSPGSELDVVLGLALGTPLGTDCTITSSLLARPALQSPLVSNFTPGIYCVRVYDIGNLRSTVNFAIRIVHT
jgi:hypothetical protein